MKEKYKNIDDFIKDVKEESVKDIIIGMGYLSEDDFAGSKVKCLFHPNDNTPSLQITDNFFKCYSCNAKGDIFKFIQLKDSLSFIEAITKLSEYFNVVIDDSSMKHFGEKKNKIAIEWDKYKANFTESTKSGAQLREILIKEARDFFPLEVGLDSNINYLVFPFTSKTGTVLGFTKRNREEKSENRPKWKHSNLKDSLVGDCHGIFNLGKSYSEIIASGEVYIVEGPRDVASMVRAGFANTIAISGTSNFSGNILDELAGVKTINFVMDGDEAGVAASMKDIEILYKANPLLAKSSYIVPLPEGKDPGVLNKDEIKDAINNKKETLSWFIEKCSDSDVSRLYLEIGSYLLKPLILKEYSKHRVISTKQALELLTRLSSNKKQIQVVKSNYKERLLATVGKCGNMEIEPLKIEDAKAARILKLRFGEKEV